MKKPAISPSRKAAKNTRTRKRNLVSPVLVFLAFTELGVKKPSISPSRKAAKKVTFNRYSVISHHGFPRLRVLGTVVLCQDS